MSYHRRRTTGAALLLVLALAACSEGGGTNSKSAGSTLPVNCSAKDIPEADWVEHCSEAQGPHASGGPKEGDTIGLALGKPAATTGDGGTGVLEMTPTTVVYSTDGAGNEPEHDVFAVVAVKQRPTTAVAATEVPPISGGGWQWIATDGQAVDEGDGISYNVVIDGFSPAGPVQPGSFVWDTVVFDLTTAQARGGTLVYLDGEDAAHRWKIPAEDTGPQTAEIKKLLKF